ncbi:tetratricopeptide repeat-containing sensor histidine kinase [Chryseobacterium lactis]|uniref:tetratricopeptide repeat-containing sensor histidine kinase n=1 Tax=Chryseobacterium lactis TaxID=1241981 RepID=UPI001628B0AF|nr:tetratricopeptide repeat-containing sensor histidine kinase [Chryseobacterium lactis]
MKNIALLILLIVLFSCNKDTRNKAEEIDYNMAYEYLNASKKDSAFKYFNRAKDYFIQKNNNSLAGNCLVNMAIIQKDYGDYYGSQETALSAIKYLTEKEDSYELSSNYNNLGIAFQDLKEYNKATKFYSLAAKFSQNTVDRLTHLNNKAVAFSYSKKFDSAISLFNRILNYPDLKKHSVLYSKVYDNQAYFKFLQDKNYNAEQELLTALKIRDSIKDNLGLIASYSHLTDYFESKNPQKSLSYANNMLHFALVNKSPDDRLSALSKIIFLENPEKAKIYFKKHQDLSDSLQTSRNKSKNQFAFERYDSEKLQRENAEKEVQLLYRNISISTMALVLIGVFFWIRRRKKRIEQEKELLKQEKELEVKNTQLKMSKKVHDVVANGIYQVMTKIENQENFDKEEALDELEFVYEKSRDISYEKPETKDSVEFDKKISVLIASFNNDYVKTYLAGNDYNVWNGVSDSVQNEIYQIIRELLVNMKKHSQASLVAFKFERKDDLIHIQYTDNGIGIQDEISHNNGLRNTVSRMETIHGQIIFDTQTEKGLKVYISFPAP